MGCFCYRHVNPTERRSADYMGVTLDVDQPAVPEMLRRWTERSAANHRLTSSHAVMSFGKDVGDRICFSFKLRLISELLNVEN